MNNSATNRNNDPEDTGQKLDTRFKPGRSGNPGGRPKGSRNKLGEAFVQALADDFSEHLRPPVFAGSHLIGLPHDLQVGGGVFFGMSALPVGRERNTLSHR